MTVRAPGIDPQAELARVHAALLAPARVAARAEALARPSAVPAEPGVYGWYFDVAPPGVPLHGTHQTEHGHLLYVGISPSKPPRNGKPPSRQNLRTRIRYHFRGNAAGSTLRLTLGSLLGPELGIQLRRVGSGNRFTYSDGEADLSAWMERHARVCWFIDRSPWVIESRLFTELVLPLNLDQNRHSAFHASLSAARRAQRATATDLPVVHQRVPSAAEDTP